MSHYDVVSGLRPPCTRSNCRCMVFTEDVIGPDFVYTPQHREVRGNIIFDRAAHDDNPTELCAFFQEVADRFSQNARTLAKCKTVSK